MMRPPRSLSLSWLALVLLLAATTALAYAPLGRLSLPVALMIAAGKAGIILALFMELAKASGLVRIIAVAGFFWLGLQIGMPAIDYLSRTEEHVTEGDLDSLVVAPPERRR